MDHPSCFGRYCGFEPNENADGGWNLSKCGACPRGFRTNETKYCIKCEESPSPYEWHFLCFMVLLPCMLDWIYILRKHSEVKMSIAQVLLSSAECISAALFTLLSVEPIGSLSMVSCGVKRLSDWYPMFYNPQVLYTETVHCTQEVVYPLLTSVCIYYAYLLILMIVLRPLVMQLLGFSKCWKDPIYASLYTLPILVAVQAIGGGLIYYAYPYISIIISIIAIAMHFIWTEVKSLGALRRDIVWNVLIMIWHVATIAFGIVSFQTNNYYYLFLVVVPVLFYFMTVHFTNPSKIDAEWTT